MSNLELLVQIIVILGFALWAYSKVKRQSLRDTFDEIKDFISGIKQNG